MGELLPKTLFRIRFAPLMEINFAASRQATAGKGTQPLPPARKVARRALPFLAADQEPKAKSKIREAVTAPEASRVRSSKCTADGPARSTVEVRVP